MHKLSLLILWLAATLGIADPYLNDHASED